jgi:hypothetical protein
MGGHTSATEPDSAALERLIFRLRGRRVMLDADLARLYGVATKRFNEAFRRHHDRFPADFAFRVTAQELADLRSQFATSSSQAHESTTESGLVGRSHGGRRYLPWAFTEHGALMVATVLSSSKAVAMSVYVVRAFVQMRNRLAANLAFAKRIAEIDRTLLEHDGALRDIYRKLAPLLEPPPDPPRRRIGFLHGGDDPDAGE